MSGRERPVRLWSTSPLPSVICARGRPTGALDVSGGSPHAASRSASVSAGTAVRIFMVPPDIGVAVKLDGRDFVRVRAYPGFRCRVPCGEAATWPRCDDVIEAAQTLVIPLTLRCMINTHQLSEHLQTKAAPSEECAAQLQPYRGGLDLDDVLRRRTLLALHDVELDALPFGERLVALRLNRGVMHEAVLLAVLGRDKAKALRVVEPLHGTGDTCHTGETPVLKTVPGVARRHLAVRRGLCYRRRCACQQTK